MHNTIYQTLPYARRQTLHVAIADWLILAHADNLLPHYPVLAYHYSQTDRHEDGIRYALLAAQEAEARYANKEATRLYNLVLAHIAALGEATQWQTAVTAHSQRAHSLRLLGEFSQAMAAATEALKLALLHGSATETLPLYNLLAEIRYAQGRYQDVQELTSHVLNSPTNRDPDLLAQAYVLAGLAANGLHDEVQALAHLEKAKKVCKRVQNEHCLVNVQTALALIYHDQAQLDGALTTALHAVEQGRSGQQPINLSLALLVLSQIYLRLGQPEEALTAVNEAIRVVQTISHHVMAQLLLQRTAVFLYTGQLSSAYTDLRDAARLLEGMDDPQTLMQLYLWWQEFYRERGELTQAQAYLARINQLLAAQTAEKATLTEIQIRFWLATAQITHHLQHPEQTKPLCHLTLQTCLAHNLLWWLPLAYYWLGLAELDQNESGATILFQQALDAVKQGGNPDMLPPISLQLALLEIDIERRERYLVTCVKAANMRAAYRERIACFRIAGPLLTASTNADLRQMGERCLHLVAWFDAEVADTA
jgi:tetratricopeptide (TPR) repeat protein